MTQSQSTDLQPITIRLSIGLASLVATVIAAVISITLFVASRPDREEVERMIATATRAQAESQIETRTEVRRLRELLEAYVYETTKRTP